MGGYTQRVRDSILPLSVAGALPDAFAEWSITENTIDHEAPIETCQLCGQQELRYHFEIANAYTNGRLWVGSHCMPRDNQDETAASIRMRTPSDGSVVRA